MSFLAGRLAATEGAYFRQESKQAVDRLLQNNPNSQNTPSSSSSQPEQEELQADVLHEVLRHAIPPKFIQKQPPPLKSSLSTSKWALKNDPDDKHVSYYSDAHNPLRAYVSLPPVTMGPKRWQLPYGEHAVLASTANSLRRERYSQVSPEKLKAAAEGLSQVGKAFFVATVIVFGGTIVAFGVVASKLELHNSDDIKAKGRDLIHSRFENIQEHLVPMRTWVESRSRKWHFEREEEVKNSPLVRELSKKLRSRTSN